MELTQSSHNRALALSSFVKIAAIVMALGGLMGCGNKGGSPSNPSSIPQAAEVRGGNQNPGPGNPSNSSRKNTGLEDDDTDEALQGRFGPTVSSEIYMNSVNLEYSTPEDPQKDPLHLIDDNLNLKIRQFFQISLSAKLYRKNEAGNTQSVPLDGPGYRITFVLLSHGTGESDLKKRYISSFETEATFSHGDCVLPRIPFEFPARALYARSVIDTFAIEINLPTDVRGFRKITYEASLQPNETSSSPMLAPADWRAGDLVASIKKNGIDPDAPGAPPVLLKESSLERFKKSQNVTPLVTQQEIQKASGLATGQIDRMISSPDDSDYVLKELCRHFYKELDRSGWKVFNRFRSNTYDKCMSAPSKYLQKIDMKFVRSTKSIPVSDISDTTNVDVSASVSYSGGTSEQEGTSDTGTWSIGGGISGALKLFEKGPLSVGANASGGYQYSHSNFTTRVTRSSEHKTGSSMSEFRVLTANHLALEFDAIYDQCLIIGPGMQGEDPKPADSELKSKTPLFFCQPTPTTGRLTEHYFFFEQIWKGVTSLHNPNSSALALFIRGQRKYAELVGALSNAANRIEFVNVKAGSREKIRRVFKTYRDEEVPGLLVR